jgi:putative spermidine/putrescine transport system permease protein
MILLADRGLINESLVRAGWITKPLPLMYNKFGVTLALVHVSCPSWCCRSPGCSSASSRS